MGTEKGLVWNRLFGFKVGDKVRIDVPKDEQALVKYDYANGRKGVVEIVGFYRGEEYCGVEVRRDNQFGGAICSHYIILARHLRKIHDEEEV